MRRSMIALPAVAAALFFAGSYASFAQAPPGGGEGKAAEGKRAEGRRGEGPGGRGQFAPEQFRQRMLAGRKQALGASDEEWKALAPKVEKVMTASREARFTGMPGFGFGRGGFGGPGGDRGGPGGDRGNRGDRGPRGGDQQNQSATNKAANDLRTALDDKATSSEDIGKKLTALRQAREKAKADFETAQKDIRELLTQRQEATLVAMGYME